MSRQFFAAILGALEFTLQIQCGHMRTFKCSLSARITKCCGSHLHLYLEVTMSAVNLGQMLIPDVCRAFVFSCFSFTHCFLHQYSPRVRRKDIWERDKVFRKIYRKRKH